MRRPVPSRAAIGLVFLLAAGSARAQTTWTLYDSFDAGRHLDGRRWADYGAGAQYDHVRGVQLGQLQLSSEAYGSAAFGAAFASATQPRGIRARVQIEKATARPCGPAGGATQVGFELYGRFFKDAASGGTSGDAVGDVAGSLEVRRDSSVPGTLGARELRGRCRITECTNSDCSIAVDLGTPVDLGVVREDEIAELSLEWEEGAERFTCRLGAAGAPVSVSYGAPVGGPAGAPLHAFRITHTEQCPAGTPVTSRRTMLHAFVDDVEIDGSSLSDADGDGVADVSDNCPGAPNPTQSDFDGDAIGDACDRCETLVNGGLDSDSDGVDNACDTCINHANPPLAGAPTENRTFLSHQRDDDADGRGNRCDFDYNNAGASVAASDFNDMKQSLLPSAGLMTQSTCGATVGNPPAGEGGSGANQRCGEFDHDGVGAVVSNTDFNLARSAVGLGGLINANFPKCVRCSLDPDGAGPEAPGWSGTLGSGGERLGRPVCQSAVAGVCSFAP